MSGKNNQVGNVLGAIRAEIDQKMLDSAFIETYDFKALTTTSDFNFVVGRRGAGKSALFIKTYDFLFKNKSGFIYKYIPKEYESLELMSVLSKIKGNYKIIKSIARVAWRISINLSILSSITTNYKFNKCDDKDYLLQYLELHKDICAMNCIRICITILKKHCIDTIDSNELPGIIAGSYEIEPLQEAIQRSLTEIGKKCIMLFDGLDEGWSPCAESTAIIGGLAATASDFIDSHTNINIILFIRDNIFRTLSYYDPDFSRHIEGNTLRLNWDEPSLFHLVANRIKVSFGLFDIEKDVKIWNRVAHKNLTGMLGFKKCLQYTLFRPRDLLVLLNTSFTIALRNGRNEIIDEDLDSSSKEISRNRLNDLIKEYETVFPGLELFIQIFKNGNAKYRFDDAISLLDTEINSTNFDDEKQSDFAILESGTEAFFALYSIGFLGLQDQQTNKLIFCHDGSPANLDVVQKDQIICVHPCYWKAIDIQDSDFNEELIQEIYDDYQVRKNPEIEDLRMKRVGQILSQLPPIPLGTEGAADFETWVFRAIQILFSGQLTNPESKPNAQAVQRRDIVATNMAKEGFWKRIYDDYSSRQVIFEVKNYKELKPEDFRQALSYASGSYGQFAIIVNRSENESISETDKGWVKEFWNEHDRLIFIIPASLLARCISKMRKTNRFDYADDALSKRLDTFTRTYLSLRHHPQPSKKKKKTKKKS